MSVYQMGQRTSLWISDAEYNIRIEAKNKQIRYEFFSYDD